LSKIYGSDEFNNGQIRIVNTVYFVDMDDFYRHAMTTIFLSPGTSNEIKNTDDTSVWIKCPKSGWLLKKLDTYNECSILSEEEYSKCTNMVATTSSQENIFDTDDRCNSICKKINSTDDSDFSRLFKCQECCFDSDSDLCSQLKSYHNDVKFI